MAEKVNWKLHGMNSLGKNLEEKIDFNIKQKLNHTFSNYELNECWNSLYGMIELFEEISLDLCRKMRIEYPKIKIKKIKNYIDKIQSLKSELIKK